MRGCWGVVRGGMGQVSECIAKAARERGVVIRCTAPVERIQVEDNRAVGVVLQGGAEEVGIDVGTRIGGADHHDVGERRAGHLGIHARDEAPAGPGFLVREELPGPGPHAEGPEQGGDRTEEARECHVRTGSR